jgi:hypothetical protein
VETLIAAAKFFSNCFASDAYSAEKVSFIPGFDHLFTSVVLFQGQIHCRQGRSKGVPELERLVCV